VIESTLHRFPALHVQEEIDVELSTMNNFGRSIAVGLITIVAGVGKKDFES
jgi:hypothetical protein